MLNKHTKTRCQPGAEGMVFISAVTEESPGQSFPKQSSDIRLDKCQWRSRGSGTWNPLALLLYGKPPFYNVISYAIVSIIPNHMWTGIRYSKTAPPSTHINGKAILEWEKKKISKQTFPRWAGKKLPCHSPTVINLKCMLFYFQRNEGFWCFIIILLTLAQEVSDLL